MQWNGRSQLFGPPSLCFKTGSRYGALAGLELSDLEIGLPLSPERQIKSKHHSTQLSPTGGLSSSDDNLMLLPELRC